MFYPPPDSANPCQVNGNKATGDTPTDMISIIDYY